MHKAFLVPLLASALAGQTPDISFFRGDPLKIARYCGDKAVALDPKEAKGLVLLGNILHAQGDKAGAENWYTKAILVDPKNEDTFVLLGSVYLFQHRDLKKAEEQFQKAELLEPKSVEIRHEIAKAWISAGDRAKVLTQVEKAMALAPREGKDAMEFAVTLLDAGYKAEATQLMDLAYKAEPKEEDRFIEYGSACLRARLTKEAVLWMERAVAVKPRELDLRREVVQAYVNFTAKEDFPLVKTHMMASAEVGFAEKDLDSAALAWLAGAHMALGEREKAEAATRRMVTASNTLEPAALAALGKVYLRLGFTNEALHFFETSKSARGEKKVLTIGGWGAVGVGSSPSGWAYANIDLGKISRKNALAESAMVLASQNMFDKALPLMEEAFLLDATDYDWLVQFWEACLKAGKLEEAARFMAKAVQAAAEDGDCWITLGEAHLKRATAQPGEAAKV